MANITGPIPNVSPGPVQTGTVTFAPDVGTVRSFPITSTGSMPAGAEVPAGTYRVDANWTVPGGITQRGARLGHVTVGSAASYALSALLTAGGGSGQPVPDNPLLTEIREAVIEVDQAKDATEADRAAAEAARVAAQLAASQAQASALTVPSWASLAVLTATIAGTGAEVLDADTGTHTDPVAGGTVPNAGRYSWSASPAGWRRIGDTGLTAKASKVELNTSQGLLGALIGDDRARIGSAVTLPNIAFGAREVRPSQVSYDLLMTAGIWADTGLPWPAVGPSDRETLGLPASVQIGDRTLDVSAYSYDLRPARGTWADSGLPFTPSGHFDGVTPLLRLGDLVINEISYDLRPLRGYSASTGAPWPAVAPGPSPEPGAAALPQMVVEVVNPALVYAYVRQAGATYVRWSILHSIRPERNADVWRLGPASHVTRSAAGVYSRVRDITFDGETDVAIQFRQSPGGAIKPDHIGGNIHGNEEMTSVILLVNGAVLDVSSPQICEAYSVEMIQISNMFEPGNTEATVWSPKGPHIMTHHKRLRLSADGWWDQWSHVAHLVGGFECYNGYFGMLCLAWGTRGFNTVHTAMRSPLWAAEDISGTFTQIASQSTQVVAFGDLYGGEVNILSGWEAPGRNLKVDNRADRRKIYPDFFEGEITSTDAPWSIHIRYRIKIKETN